MENFVFENPTKVFFGKGCVREYLSGLAAPYQGSIMLAWGGGSIRRNGVYDEVCAALRATGRKIVEFSGIMSNPTYRKMLEGAALARKENVGAHYRCGRRVGHGLLQGHFHSRAIRR